MGNRTGFHSGEVHADRMKIGDMYVNERQFIKKEDFDATYISGTAATAYTFVSESAQGVPTYNFTGGVQDQLAFRFVAPSSLKRNERPQFRLYWTTSGVDIAGLVDWEIQHWAASVLVSGAESSGKNYNISGAVSPDGLANVSTQLKKAIAKVSGVIQETVIGIPSEHVAAGDLVRVQLSRMGINTTLDTISLKHDVHLIGVLIEYVDG